MYLYLLCLLLQGYVKRQAVFACNTCTPSAAEHAGICLACTNKCHDGHDIFELYTKRYFVRGFSNSALQFSLPSCHNLLILLFFCCRNFRCDCGNGKFGEFKCQLFPVSPPAFFLTESVSLSLSAVRFCLQKLFHPLYSQAKDEENVRNHYNHNFSGCYCTCDRPYPDTDDQVVL